MKILFITHSFPYPFDEGIKVVNYNLLKQLKKKHKVSLLSLIESDIEKKYIKNIKDYCDRIETVTNKIRKGIILRLWNITFQKNPFCVYQFYSNKLKDKLIEMTATDKYDILHFDFVNTAIYRKYVKDIPAVYFPHDAMSMLFYRNSIAERNLFKKYYYLSQFKKMQRFEIEISKLFDRIIFVSDVDKNWVLEKDKSLKTEVIPNGIDTDYFKPQNIKEDYPSIIFRGIMSFFPNIDAIIYFIKDIFPVIKREIKEIKLYIVGKNPSQDILKYNNNKDIVVTGYVEDIREFMQRATVNICPMRIGSGIKNKILEALSMEKATVATKIACDGIPELENGKNILIADTEEEFAEKVILLIRDENLRLKLGKEGRKLIIRNYTWENVAGRFEKLYEDILKERNRKSSS